MLCLAGLITFGTAFAQQCVDNGETVTDNATGLMWQKATLGPMNWNTAMSYASSLFLGGYSDWRLPSRDELQGLYFANCRSMLVEHSDFYWSSTTYDPHADYAWHVDFQNGNIDWSAKLGWYHVRAVRYGQ